MASNGHIRLQDLRKLEDYVVAMADKAVGAYSLEPPNRPTAQDSGSGWKPAARIAGGNPSPVPALRPTQAEIASQQPVYSYQGQTAATADPRQARNPSVVKAGQTGGPVPIISGGLYDPALTEGSWAPYRPVPEPQAHDFPAVQPQAPLTGTASWGASGTPITAGFLLDLGEYNPKLYGRSAVRVYEEMRRSMGQVWGTLRAAKQPSFSASWEIRPGVKANDPGYAQAKEVADFVRDNLFGGMEFSTSTGGVSTQSWASVVYNAMLMLDFGCSCHEDNWKIDGNYIKIRNLPARLPLTYYRHHTEADGETLIALEQYGYRGWEFVNASLPMQKACFWVLNQEGGNFWGISMTRPMYGHWYSSQALYRIEAIAAERNSLGLPVIGLGPGYSSQDRSTAFNYVTQLSAHELAGLVLPPNHTFEFQGVKGQTRDSLKLIEHHLRQISATGLQHFLSIGSAPHGSRATAQTQHNFFMAASQYIAGHFAETLRQSTIRRLVRLNFGDEAPIPNVIAKNMRSADITDILNSLFQLAGAGLLVSDKPLREFIRDGLDLPEETGEDIVTSKGETIDEGDAQFQAPKSGAMPQQQLEGAGNVKMWEIHRPWTSTLADSACHWVTINGNHVCITEDGIITKGPHHLVGKSVGARGEHDQAKVERAKANYNPATREKQIVADNEERKLAILLHAERTPDNAPFDLLKGGHAIEVKTVVGAKNDKITMHPESLARKLQYANLNRVHAHTIVVDRRSGKAAYYYKDHLGSFRFGSQGNMERVSGRELRDRIS